ncbi:MAG: ABC transporter permease [Rhodospirillales bacterium]|nr:ABC transporter permease [Rhodospirillales bacterium]
MQQLERKTGQLKLAQLTKDSTTARIDLAAVSQLDTAGVLFLIKLEQGLRQLDQEVRIESASQRQRQLMTAVREHVCRPAAQPKHPPGRIALLERPLLERPLLERPLLESLGRGAFRMAGDALLLLNFLGNTVAVLVLQFLRPWRIRWRAVVRHMETAGLDALPIVGLISFLIGLVLAFQGAAQLQQFGAQIFTVNIVGIGVLREMAILLTAIVVAGRSGSAFAAQIGSMQVNEEIDALRSLGLDPMEVLVLPRVLGLVAVMPFLAFYADLMGLLGGAVMIDLVLGIPLWEFIAQLRQAVSPGDLFVGLIKAPPFAFLIALVGCFEGFRVSRSAEAVGQATTRAVVEGIFLVIVLDALLSIFFQIVGV